MAIFVRSRFLIAVLVLAFAFEASGTIRRRVVRSLSSFANPTATQLFTIRTSRLLGGVVLFSEIKYYNEHGELVSPAQISISEYDKIHDVIKLRYAGKSYELKFDESQFNRMFCWIENNGRSLFTAYTDEESTLNEGGLTPVENWMGAIASEFRDCNKCCEIAADFDYRLKWKPYEKADSIKQEINERIKINSSTQYFEDLGYLVADRDAEFKCTLVDGQVRLSGDMFRYHRKVIHDREENQEVDELLNRRVIVYQVDISVPITDIIKPINERFKTLKLRYEENLDRSLALFTSAEILDEIRTLKIERRHAINTQRKQLRCLDFARKASLLRTIYTSNRDSWEKFADGHFDETILLTHEN